VSIVKGALYIVATPLGNLGDITRRAVKTLAEVDLVAAEDTRHSRRLLQHLGITTACMALHEHNENQMVPRILARLEAGQAVALVSDAGTPLISDPGFELVRRLRERDFPVIPIPGPSAVITALSVAGLPCERFVFEGFLPARGAARQRRLEALRVECRTLVFYEAPHRIQATLADMKQILGDQREAVIARELTKAFETVRHDTLGSLLSWVAGDANQRRGEFVIMVGGRVQSREEGEASVSHEHLLTVLLASHSLKQAVSLAAEISGAGRNRLYELAIRLNEKRLDSDPEKR